MIASLRVFARVRIGARFRFPERARRPPRAGPVVGPILALTIAACSFGGIVEFESYKASFDKVQATSTSILDQLAQQERWFFFSVNKGARNPIRFDPALARYYTDSVDPPGTASFRAALDTIKTYNDLLYGLESGQTAEALSAKVAALESSI